VAPDSVLRLSEKKFFRVMRWLQRLATPSRKASNCQFGQCLGRRVSRGSGHGSSVWFSRPETVERMIAFACREFPLDGKAKLGE
jgi:hypothetical protein